MEYCRVNRFVSISKMFCYCSSTSKIDSSQSGGCFVVSYPINSLINNRSPFRVASSQALSSRLLRGGAALAPSSLRTTRIGAHLRVASGTHGTLGPHLLRLQLLHGHHRIRTGSHSHSDTHSYSHAHWWSDGLVGWWLGHLGGQLEVREQIRDGREERTLTCLYNLCLILFVLTALSIFSAASKFHFRAVFEKRKNGLCILLFIQPFSTKTHLWASGPKSSHRGFQ